MLNLNKLFPRLPIRSKLAIAFALLATIPLVLTGAFGTRITLGYIRGSTAATLDHDLQTARERTEHLLAAAEEDARYLAEGPLRQALEKRTESASLERAVRAFLRLKSSFVQVKLLTADGEPILIARALPDGPGASGEPAGGAYYGFRARSLKAGQRLLLPVEIRGSPAADNDVRAIPAIAFVYPLHNEHGTLLGIAVGEAYASKLFAALESGSPQLPAVTGLVGADGQFLYHSERKSDWSSLLATRPEVNLMADFPTEVARRIVAGSSGSLTAKGDQLVSFAPLRLSDASGGQLFLYRVVPSSLIEKPARRFLWGVGTGGLLVLVLALALAVVGAAQFTRPIYQIREGARRLAEGRFEQDLKIETNDELEDLAVDFTRMADRLRRHTEQLEGLVTQRTEALREAHSELEEILVHSEDAILRVDRDGRIRVWNRGAEKMFGYPTAEAIGRSVDELLLPRDVSGRREAAYIRRQVKRTGAILNHHTVRLRKGGEPVEVSLSQTAIAGPSGEAVGHTLIIRDVGKQKALERQMLRSERLAAAGRVAAGIAHEINNPIGIIHNRLECLELEIAERCPECPASQDLQVIRHQAERVGNVARRLLGFAREERDVRAALDLNELVARVLRFLEPTFEKKAMRVEWDLASGLPVIHGNPQGLETVLLNLLLNAVDASAHGGTVSVATRTAGRSRAVELEVIDAGLGIPAELHERIFEPFFTTKQRAGGTGLGLAVSRSIIQAHGGEIRVRSSPGMGSTFTITLPLGRRRKDGNRAHPDRR